MIKKIFAVLIMWLVITVFMLMLSIFARPDSFVTALYMVGFVQAIILVLCGLICLFTWAAELYDKS